MNRECRRAAQSVRFFGTLVALGALAACGISANPQKVAARAEKNLAARNYRAAAVDLENLLATQPNNVRFRLELARAQLHTNAHEASEIDFRKAQQLGAPWTAVLPGLAEALLDEGKPQTALDELNKHQPGDAPDAKLISLRGRALVALRRFDDARTALTEALRLDAHDTKARVSLAVLLQAQGNASGAQLELENAIAAAPDDFSAHLALGVWYARHRQIDDARNEFRKALTIALKAIDAGAQPLVDEAQTRLYLADTDLALGDTASAEKQLARIKKLLPHRPATLLLQARVALQQKRTDAAESALQELLSRDPRNERAEVLLGLTDATSGNLAQAEMYLTSAVAQNPGDLAARRLLAQVQLRENQPKKALQTATASNTATDADLLALAAEASAQTGDLESATHYLERSEKAAPQDKLRALDLAASYLEEHRAPDALKLLGSLSVPESLIDRRELLLLTALSRIEPADRVSAEAKRFAASRPRDAASQLVAARALATDNDMSGARDLINASAHIDSHSPAPWIALGALEISQHDLPAADSAYRQALQLDPRSVDALLGKAQVSLLSGKRDTAIEELQQARTASPTSLLPRLTLARLYLMQGDPAHAAAPLAEARKIAPDDVAVQLLAGAAALAQGNGPDAVATFEKLTGQFPKAAVLKADLARAYIVDQRPADANDAAADAVKLDPNYWPALLIQADLSLRDKDLKSVAGDLQRLRSAKAPPAAIQSLAGDLAVRNGNLAEALRDYRGAAATAPSGNLALVISEVLHAQHAANPDGSLRDWLQRHPNDARVRLGLAQYLQQEGDRNAAAKEYQTVLSSSPNAVVALNNLAWLDLQNGQNEAGLEFARRAYKQAPSQASVADTFGWALLQTGDPNDAITVLRTAFGAAPNDATIQFHFAVALLKTGATADARRELQAIVDAKPQGPESKQARSLLASLGGSKPP